eukprot:TRINITY_DN43972_c0_g1_i1.p1 TRINITY_DN43972_c0_g1~~TRINITY_DN43972_c0_g1_i1.p1  ORF type:complete len:985 (-),score=223.44 TRINITY_DN43972_c0_g1_i1:64-3018(-)
MESELESDMLSPSAASGTSESSLKQKQAVAIEHEEGDFEEGGDEAACACCDEDEEEEEGPSNQEDVREQEDEGEMVEEAGKEMEEGEDEEDAEGGEDDEPGAETAAEGSAPSKQTKKKRKRAKSVGAGKSAKQETSKGSSQRARSVGARLSQLSKPRAPAEAPLEDQLLAKPEKKKTRRGPSLLLKIRPSNLHEAMEAFFASGFTEAPQFTYSYPDDVVAKAFQDNSTVCFDYLPEAERIMDKVQQSMGGSDAFMQLMYGTDEEKVPCEELHSVILEYLRDHNLEDKVEIRIVEGMLSAANVLKGQADAKYVVNIAKGPISRPIIQSIADHEVGTHLLRMMNDEHQIWHGVRERYKMINPWTTEEGFATLNTYMTLPSKLMYPQALRYWAVCRGAQTGFVELFNELRTHISDAKRCWQICCRIKRGMLDTSQPGAFYMDQAYFKGAVEILKHLDEVDFGRLYSGQIALQDLDKVHFLLRKELVRLPRFLNSAEKLQAYLVHCRALIKENMIETSTEKVCKRFVCNGMEFFKKEDKRPVAKAVTLGSPSNLNASRTMDLSRLEDLARPRNFFSAGHSDVEDDSKETAARERRQADQARLAELAVPRRTVTAEEEKAESHCSRTLDLARLSELARPKQTEEIAFEAKLAPKPKAQRGSSAPAGDRASGEARWGELARPKAKVEVPPPPEPPGGVTRPVDLVRLASLAVPKKTCDAEDAKGPCDCKPKKTRRKRRSKLRLLAMVQEKKEAASQGLGAGEDEGGDERMEEINADEQEEEGEEVEESDQVLGAALTLDLSSGTQGVVSELQHEGAEEAREESKKEAAQSWTEHVEDNDGQNDHLANCTTEQENEELLLSPEKDMKKASPDFLKETGEACLNEFTQSQVEASTNVVDSPPPKEALPEVISRQPSNSQFLHDSIAHSVVPRLVQAGVSILGTADKNPGYCGAITRYDKSRLSVGYARASGRALPAAAQAVPIKTLQLDLGF